MRFDNNKWVTNILKVVDTLNTLNGGIISPTFKLIRYTDNYELLIKVPGVSPESIRVEIIENKLMIYHLLEMKSGEVIPNILKVIPVPKEVDLRKITAEFEGKLLNVHLPFGEKTDGFFKSVDIEVNS